MLTSALGDGIVQIRLPMRDNPLRYINAYVVEEDDGLTLIDCGWRTDDVLAALHDGLASFGARLGDVRRLYVTHFHFDHYGLAATLLRAGLPYLAMHERDWIAVQRILDDPQGAERESDAFLARNGYAVEPEETEDPYRRRGELAAPHMFFEDRTLYGRLLAVWTPGHSPGHVCFRDTRSGKLFSGDHILDPVTPHVGMWFADRGNPLGEYVASLHVVATVDARGILPAHGEPFDDVARRIAELLDHTARRDELVLHALESGAKSAADVARGLPWTRRELAFETLGEWHRQFAVAETLAHLENARATGGVVRDERMPPTTYALAP